MKLSKSSVKSFLTCRRQFKYQYIDKIEVKSNENMLLGTTIHDVAEKVAKDIQKAEEVDSDFIMDSFVGHYPYDSGFEKELIIGHLDNLYDFFVETFIDNDYKIFSVEEYIHNTDIDLSGLADLVLENSDGDLIVIDYKTGKSRSVKEYRLELCYYKNLLEYQYPDKTVVTAGIFFTKDSGYRFINFVEDQEKGAFIDAEDYEAALSLLDEIRKEVDNGNIYPKRQFICKYCSYDKKCREDGGF